nr:NADH-plastoquinone oxidoreductase subunit J [Isolepis setacea]
MVKFIHNNVREINRIEEDHLQNFLSDWLVNHELVHRSLGFDSRGIETLQIKAEDWDSIGVILYVYGYNYLRSQCVYDVAPGGFLGSVYHLTRIQYDIYHPEEICIKVFVSRNNPRIPSVLWIWRSADFQERESYDMLGISYDNHPRLKRILMPESWIGWPLRKDYITPNFYEMQDAL